MDQKCPSSRKINGGNGEQWDCKTQPTHDIIGSVEKMCVYAGMARILATIRSLWLCVAMDEAPRIL